MKHIDENILIKYLLGECSTEDLEKINGCIGESKEEAHRFFKAEELYHLGKLENYMDEEVINRAQQKVHKRIQQEKKTNKRVFNLYTFIKYAAVIIFAVFAGNGIYWLIDTKENLLTVSTDEQIKDLILPDGTKVSLNKHSLIKYPQKFSKKNRKVYLEGEAFFEVAKNQHKPFIVKNEVMSVRVMGTVFNMKNVNSCKIAEATLVEGQIEVTANKNNGQVVLTPGQRAELNKTSGLLTVKQVDTKMDIAWHNNMISFKQANLQEISATLEQYYQKKIILSADMQLTKTYSGVLKKKPNIEEALEALQNTIPFNFKVSEDHILISPK